MDAILRAGLDRLDLVLTAPDGGRARLGDPRVSIVVTCYNYGHFLEDCLESALGQTHPADEIIVVNNKSTDSTAKQSGPGGMMNPTSMRAVRTLCAIDLAASESADRIQVKSPPAVG